MERKKTIFNYGFDFAKNLVSKSALKRLSVFLPTPVKIMTVLRKAYEKNGQEAGINSIAADLFDKSKLLGQLISAYFKNEYREIEPIKIAMIISSILYFVSPLDLIPDGIPFIGYLDDIAIMTWLFKNLSEELDKFDFWLKEQVIVEASEGLTS